MSMHRRKKPKKKSQPSLSHSEQALLDSILKDIQHAGPETIVARIPDSRFAQILIDQLPLKDQSAIPLLAALSERFNDKPARKAVKRGMFRLMKKGISIGELQKDKESSTTILKPPLIEKPVCHIGPIMDMAGFRAILMLVSSGGKGQRVGMGLVSNEKGINDFLYVTSSKKKLQEIKGDISQQAGPLVETSISHVATILEEAYQQHIRLHPDAPEHYLALRPWLLENAPLLDRPVVYNVMSKESVSDIILTESLLNKLFQHKFMEFWLIDFERIKPFIEKIHNVEESSIILTDAQKSEQIRQIKEKCVKELFPEHTTARLKRRFEEMAYVFHNLNENDFSNLSLAAAWGMDEKNTLCNVNPVTEFLCNRSINSYLAMANKEVGGSEKEEKTSRIVLA